MNPRVAAVCLDPERRNCRYEHEPGPDPPGDPVQKRALAGEKDHRTERERSDSSEEVDPDYRCEGSGHSRHLSSNSGDASFCRPAPRGDPDATKCRNPARNAAGVREWRLVRGE